MRVRRQLNGIEQMDIGRALRVAAGRFEIAEQPLAAMRCDALSKLVENADAMWLETEQGQPGNEIVAVEPPLVAVGPLKRQP